MISSQPEKLLRYLLPSIGDGNNFLAMHLGGLIFKLEFVKKTVGEIHYKLSIVTFDNPSVDEPEERTIGTPVLIKVSVETEQRHYKAVAEYVCHALPNYVILHKGMEAERSLAHCHLHIVKANKEK